MKHYIAALAIPFLALLYLERTRAQTAASAPTKLNVTRDVPYAEPADPRQRVDIYAPAGAKNLPVVFWIHGGGWQAGDRTNVQVKPQAFEDKTLVCEGLRLDLNVGPVASLPASAVNPENHSQVFCPRRRVDVHPLSGIRRLGVGDVTCHVELGWRGGGGLSPRPLQVEQREKRDGKGGDVMFHSLSQSNVFLARLRSIFCPRELPSSPA